MRSILRIFTIAVLLITVFSAVYTTPIAAADPVTLTLATIQFSGDTNSYVDEIIKKFEEQNPDIKVKVEIRSVDAHKEALRTLLTTTAAPDLYFMWGGIGLGGFYISAAEPLDDYYAKYKWEDRFLPTALAAAKFDGKYYGVPYTIHGMSLYYRKDLFEKAGITGEPTTYQELMDANAKLKAAGITPLSVGGKFGWNTMRLTDSLLETFCGAELHSKLKAMNADWSKESCVTEAFTELRKWVDLGYLPENFLGIDPGEAAIPVYKGNAAMQYEGDWRVQALETDGEDLANYDFFPFPTGTKRLSFFTELLFITKASQHKDEAAKLIDFWTSPEIQTQYQGRFGSVSPTKDVTVPTDRRPLDAKWAKVMGEFPDIYPPADQELPNELVAAYFKVQDDVIAGTTKPEAAGGLLQAEIEKYKAK